MERQPLSWSQPPRPYWPPRVEPPKKKKHMKLFLLSVFLIAISAFFADKTDFFGNLTNPPHVAMAIWFAIMGIVAGVGGIITSVGFLAETFE